MVNTGTFNTSVFIIFLIIVAILCIVMIAIGVILFTNQKKLSNRLDKLLTNSEGEDIEESLNNKFKRLELLEQNERKDDEDIQEIYNKFEHAFQKSGIVKYDAYMENGGKLSFALALLDENDNGFILNVMNSREGSFCYIKDIKAGECDIALGDEEAEALAEAMNVKGKKNVRRKTFKN